MLRNLAKARNAPVSRLIACALPIAALVTACPSRDGEPVRNSPASDDASVPLSSGSQLERDRPATDRPRASVDSGPVSTGNADASRSSMHTDDTHSAERLPTGQLGGSDRCTRDEDCVPAQCCHAAQCVERSRTASCQDVMCTMECRAGTLDCGGHCACREGHCAAVIAPRQYDPDRLR